MLGSFNLEKVEDTSGATEELEGEREWLGRPEDQRGSVAAEGSRG